MNIEKEIFARSGSKCELCGNSDELSAFQVAGSTLSGADEYILACNTCRTQIELPEQPDPNHWRCLNDSMWSSVPAVQVTAWRMLNRLKQEGWPQDLLDMLYLDEETLAWAQAGQESEDEDSPKHRDSNGALLEAGDTVVLIKDLDVKGANFTAKRGTAVRGISLVADNPEHIEGKVNGQQIVILTKFVKKSN